MEKQIVEQKEALETLIEFNERLIKNMNIIIKELSGARLDDTDAFLKGIIDAMNWEIGVMNGTLSLLNRGEERVHKVEFNEKVIAFGKAIENKNDSEMVATIRDLIPEFQNLGEAARVIIQK